MLDEETVQKLCEKISCFYTGVLVYYLYSIFI